MAIGHGVLFLRVSMEKKELQSMTKHRGLFWSLGLTALLGLSAREVNAEPMTLEVFLDGSSIYSTSGPAVPPGDGQSVTADTDPNGALNSALLGTGYSFSGLSGSSNWPGTTSVVGGFISTSGNLSFDPANGATGGVLTIVVSENGFTAPVGGVGNVLTSVANANYSGTGAGSAGPPLAPTYQTYLGSFSDSSGPAVTGDTPLITQLSNGTASDGHSDSSSVGLPFYVTPYTLTGTTTISMNSATDTPSNNVFGNKTSVLAVPEPASLIMMVTGMPLPLVVMGLLRRRRARA